MIETLHDRAHKEAAVPGVRTSLNAQKNQLEISSQTVGVLQSLQLQ